MPPEEKIVDSSDYTKNTTSLVNLNVTQPRNTVKSTKIPNLQTVSSIKLSDLASEDNFYREVSVLSEGSSFGELALLQHKPRAATIICKERCYIATLDKQSYDRILKKGFQNLLNANVKFLQSIPFFSKWTKNSLAKFSYYFQKKSFKRNQFVYKEGETGSEVSLVINGDFEVKKKIKNLSTSA